MILSFSGTGNSLYLAEALGDRLNMDNLDLFQSIKEGQYVNLESQDPYIVVAPIYGWRIPKFFSEYLEKTKLSGNKDIYFITNCGDSMGNAPKYNRELAERMGMNYMGTFKVVMPENYLLLYKASDKEEEDQLIRKSHAKIEEIAKVIDANLQVVEKAPNIMEKAMSGLINPLFYTLIVKANKFKVSDKCISCGKCAEKCVLNNIVLVDGKPVWSENCTHCCACISYCPVEAIDYGSTTKNKRRYVCRTYK